MTATRRGYLRGRRRESPWRMIRLHSVSPPSSQGRAPRATEEDMRVTDSDPSPDTGLASDRGSVATEATTGRRAVSCYAGGRRAATGVTRPCVATSAVLTAPADPEDDSQQDHDEGDDPEDHPPGPQNTAGHGRENGSPHSQARAHRACHFLGRLARRGRCLPGSVRRRSDQSACPSGARRLPRDGVARLGRPRAVCPCLAAHRACQLDRHDVGRLSATTGCWRNC